jgi:type IV secretion system protein VirB4
MLRLDKVIKPWKESAALNDHINLYGFWNETTFLTKSGDLGMVSVFPVWTTKVLTIRNRSMQ